MVDVFFVGVMCCKLFLVRVFFVLGEYRRVIRVGFMIEVLNKYAHSFVASY
jgi:hypothetical protein